MKKLRLDLDSVAVETFPTEAPKGEEGTVVARDANPSIYPYCTHGTYPCRTSLSLCPCTDTI